MNIPAAIWLGVAGIFVVSVFQLDLSFWAKSAIISGVWLVMPSLD